jgi:hypothetical protein
MGILALEQEFNSSFLTEIHYKSSKPSSAVNILKKLLNSTFLQMLKQIEVGYLSKEASLLPMASNSIRLASLKEIIAMSKHLLASLHKLDTQVFFASL